MSLPGYGDEATWPPCTGNVNDPRTPEPPEDTDDMTAEERSDELEALQPGELYELVDGLEVRVQHLEACVKAADKVFKAQDAWPTVGWTLVEYQAMRKLVGEIK